MRLFQTTVEWINLTKQNRKKRVWHRAKFALLMHLAVCNWFLSYILRYGSVNRNLHKLGKWSQTPDKRSRRRGKTFRWENVLLIGSSGLNWPKRTNKVDMMSKIELLQPSGGTWNEREFCFMLAGCLQRLERTRNTRSHGGWEVRNAITKWLFRVSSGIGNIPTRFNIHKYFTSRKSIF